MKLSSYEAVSDKEARAWSGDWLALDIRRLPTAWTFQWMVYFTRTGEGSGGTIHSIYKV